MSKSGYARKVRVMINPNSGPFQALGRLYKVMEMYWNVQGIDLTYQVSRSAEDGRDKVRRAIDDGVDTVIVVGGDGMVNSIGRELIGTDVALGVIPAGSGNGFARHFATPLTFDAAAASLRQAHRRKIDVGLLNGQPFFVTASMAWDAALMKTFEKMPVRGMAPYIFSAVYEYFDYQPQPVTLEFDDGEVMHLESPMVLTVANLTEYGGGAQIAPGAEADDGCGVHQHLPSLRREDRQDEGCAHPQVLAPGHPPRETLPDPDGRGTAGRTRGDRRYAAA